MCTVCEEKIKDTVVLAFCQIFPKKFYPLLVLAGVELSVFKVAGMGLCFVLF